MTAHIESFYHANSSTISYVVYDSQSLKGMVIDPAIDFDLSSGSIAYHSCDEMISFIDSHHLDIDWIVETHAHADHITGAAYLKSKLGAKIGVSQHITQVQRHFVELFDLNIPCDGSQFDHLFKDNEVIQLGQLSVTVIETPGHTPDSVCYLVENAAFIGDTLFMPDSGTARCDFPGGSASQLFHSIQRIFELDDQTHLYMCHDYQPNGRELSYVTTIEAQKQYNIHVKAPVTQHEYVATRETRDEKLAVPKLLYPAIQMNINAGNLPASHNNGQRYLKIPLSVS